MTLRTSLVASPARSPLSARNPNSLDLHVRSSGKPALTKNTRLETKRAPTAETTVQQAPGQALHIAPSLEVFGEIGVLESRRGATPAVHKLEGRTANNLGMSAGLAPQTEWTVEEWAEWEAELWAESKNSKDAPQQWSHEEWVAWETTPDGQRWTAEEWAQWEAEAPEDDSEDPVTSAFGETGQLQFTRGSTPEAHKLEGRFARSGIENSVTSAFGETGLLQFTRGSTPEAYKLEGRFARSRSIAANSLHRSSLGHAAPKFIPPSMRMGCTCIPPVQSDEPLPTGRAEGRRAAMKYLVPARFIAENERAATPSRGAAPNKMLVAAALEVTHSVEPLIPLTPSSLSTNGTVMYGGRSEPSNTPATMDEAAITGKVAEVSGDDVQALFYNKPPRTRWETLAGLRAIEAELKLRLPHLPYGLNPPPPNGPRPDSDPNLAANEKDDAHIYAGDGASSLGEQKNTKEIAGIGLTEDDIVSMRVVDLRAALSERGLPTKGRKAELITLLQQACLLPPPL
jgi:hypothetical protein